MLACPDHGDWRPDVWIWIAILALWISVSRWESTLSGRLQQSSHICVLERNPKAWLNTESCSDGLLNRPDGCKLEQFEASRHEGRSGRESTSSGWMMLWIDGCPDGMTCPLDGRLGIKFSYLQTMQNLLETLLNSKIPVKNHLYKEVILSNRMWPITN
jgi:hypothetical protein